MLEDVLEAPAIDLTATLAGAVLPNPVLTAAGCAMAGRELAEFVDVSRLGAVVTPSVTRDPRAGSPTPRITETPSGLLSAVGMPGPGIDALLAADLPWLDHLGARAVVSIAGRTIGEYAELAGRLHGAPAVSLLEINLSCPSAEDGRDFACDPDAAGLVVAEVRAAADPATPVFAKLSPNVTDIVPVAQACALAGADGLSMINTVAGVAVDPYTMRPALADIFGGLSGPAVRPVAVRCVWQVHAALPQLPILGMGGITCGLDALQFVLAGASAVSVGTALFHDPGTPLRVLDELRDLLVERGFERLADAVGQAHRPEEDV
ncbi:MAG TPA: dihydroorotate dehydrogenase [Mycobacteriales bacterium]